MTQYREEKIRMINDRKRQVDSIKYFIDKGNYSKATSEIIHYLDKNPSDMYGQFLHGRLLVLMNDYENAKQVFSTVASSESKNRYTALVELGNIAKLEGKIDKAREYYKRAIEKSPNTEFDAIFALSDLERQQRNYDEALKVLNLLDNYNVSAKIEKVKILIEQGKRSIAETMLFATTPINRYQERQIALEKGKLSRLKGEWTKAKFYYLEAKEALEKDEVYYQTLYEEAKLAMYLGNYDEVVDNCEELYTTKRSFNKEINLMLAQAKQIQGKYKSALENYHLAIDSTNDNIHYESCYHLGLMEFMMGNLEEAKNHLKISLGGNKISKSEVYQKLIGILLKEKKYKDARVYLDKLKEVYSEATSYPYTLDAIELLIDKNTGKQLPRRDKAVYINKQVIKYNKMQAIHHIKTRHQTTNTTSSGFSKTINIDTLYEIIRHQMTTENMINEDIFDIYEIDYPRAGYDRETMELVDRIRVIVIPGTKDIITMYPCHSSKTPRQGDISKIFQQDTINKNPAIAKNKQNDRISRFYQRYNKNNN